MASHENTAQARRNIGTESAGRPSPITKRLAAGEYATTIGDHQFSRLTCARVPCARNGGKIEAGFHSRRSLPSPACPSQRISFRRTDGNWVLVWLFFRPRVRGSQGTSPFEFRQYRQTRFGYARSKRSQPQFKAHNSVRPFENGLRSLGSSATRPGTLYEPLVTGHVRHLEGYVVSHRSTREKLDSNPSKSSSEAA